MEMNIKIHALMPIVESPVVTLSLNAKGYHIDNFESIKSLDINKHPVHLSDAYLVYNAKNCILGIARDMIHVMASTFDDDDISKMEGFTMDLIHNDAEFDETYNWNPHIAEVVLTYTPKQHALKAKLYAVTL